MRNCRVRLEDKVMDVCLEADSSAIPEGIADLIKTVCRDYSYLLGCI